MEAQSWWEVLGCAPDADDKTIRDRYRTLAHLYHPDRWAEAPQQVRDESASRMRELNEAFKDAQSQTRSSASRSDVQGEHWRPEADERQGTSSLVEPPSSLLIHPSGWQWFSPAHRGFRHPNGVEWLKTMERKNRTAVTAVSGDPVSALESCRDYAVRRRWWKLLAFDANEGFLSFRGRVGGKTWSGQIVTVWIEPAPELDVWNLLGVAESGDGWGILEWNEAAAVLAELFDNAGLPTVKSARPR